MSDNPTPDEHKRMVTDMLGQMKMFKKEPLSAEQQLIIDVKSIGQTVKDRAKPILDKGINSKEDLVFLQGFLVQQLSYEFNKAFDKDTLVMLAAITTMHEMTKQD